MSLKLHIGVVLPFIRPHPGLLLQLEIKALKDSLKGEEVQACFARILIVCIWLLSSWTELVDNTAEEAEICNALSNFEALK